MTLYTVVHDGYDVDVYTTKKALENFIVAEGLLLEPDAEKPSAAAVRKAIKELDWVMYLYEEDRDDWKYRVEIQKRVNLYS